MSALITSFFTRAGVPAADIHTVTPGFPTIRIWEVSGADQTLIIGTPEGTGDPGGGIGTDGIMTVMHDKTAGAPGSGGPPPAGSIDGFYKFEFTAAMGFSELLNYVIRVDGGTSIPAGERYQTQQFGPDDSIDTKVDAVYDETATDHLSLGSFGLLFNQTKANTDQLLLDVADVEALVDLVRKYNTNRTKVDTTAKTLIVFDDDCTTPLRTFSLRDASNIPSTDDVCERNPTATGTSDGEATCLP